MHTILEILNRSTDYLQQKGIRHAKRQAEELLGEALQIGRMGLYLEFDRPLNEVELALCRDWLKRRGQGEPLQYISGKVEFFGCDMLVNPDVLIPRQETEILVDKIVKQLAQLTLQDKVLWDVCCGSGCIGIAIKKACPDLKVILSDISPAALAQAKLNAGHNDVEVEFLQGDLLAAFGDRKCDFLVCNPPYIADMEMAGLDVEVRAYEPKQALLAGATGLEFYQRLAKDLPRVLNPSARVWFEIGKDQGDALKMAFQAPHWKQCAVESDWSGQARFFSLEIE